MPYPIPVRYAAEAISDIDGIFNYIARDNPLAAEAVLAAIEDAVDLLCYFPRKGRKTRERGVKALPLSRFPYIVFYRVIEGELVVLHVYHGARRHPGFQEPDVEFAS